MKEKKTKVRRESRVNARVTQQLHDSFEQSWKAAGFKNESSAIEGLLERFVHESAPLLERKVTP